MFLKGVESANGVKSAAPQDSFVQRVSGLDVGRGQSV
jgi:hypothetical protein